jgi:hypothetical protein
MLSGFPLLRTVGSGWGFSSVGRALAWHARGQGFESPKLHNDSRKPVLVGAMTAQSRVRYADTRPYVTPETLEELAGPATGVLELPISLDWSERRSYDLSVESDRRLMYERVIREAMSADILRRYLNSALLLSIWPNMYLPRRVKASWESRFPVLSHVG